MELINKGTYGQIYRTVSDGQTWAIKVVKNEQEKGVPGSFLRELTVLRYANHPHVLQSRDASIDHLLDNFSLQLPYADFDLRVLVKTKEYDPLPLIKQLASGLYYLRELNVLHGDLKPENILIYTSGSHESLYHLRIADFGIAYFESSGSIVQGEMTSFFWKAPEELASFYEAIPRGFSSVNWTFGCICYYLLTKRIPFAFPTRETENYAEELFHALVKGLGLPKTRSGVFEILRNNLPLPSTLNKDYTLHVKGVYLDTLIKKCLRWQAGERISTRKICLHLGLEVAPAKTRLEKLKDNTRDWPYPSAYSDMLVYMKEIYKETMQSALFRDQSPVEPSAMQAQSALFRDQSPVEPSAMQAQSALFRDQSPVEPSAMQAQSALFRDQSPVEPSAIQAQSALFREILPLALNIYRQYAQTNKEYALAYLSLAAKLRTESFLTNLEHTSLLRLESKILEACEYKIWSTTANSYLELVLEKEPFMVLDAARSKLTDLLLSDLREADETLAWLSL